jgi:hypothetical protein
LPSVELVSLFPSSTFHTALPFVYGLARWKEGTVLRCGQMDELPKEGPGGRKERGARVEGVCVPYKPRKSFSDGVTRNRASAVGVVDIETRFPGTTSNVKS